MCKIIFHPNYKKYDLGEGHPFNPVRVEMVLDLLDELGFLKEVMKADPVSPEYLSLIHDSSYINAIEAVSSGNSESAEEYGLGTIDNPVVKGMAEGARYHVAGTVLGARQLLKNEAKKVLQLGGGFHHAQRDFASGFCLYNDIALAIKEMTNAGWHVAYLDLDVHHGDGVQKIFYSDDKVMTISIHESGEYLFPGSGWLHELGAGTGRSLKINVPLEPFTEGASYLEVFNGIVEPAVKWFKPDALVVQAGADAHFSDPLADLMLTIQDFQKIFKKVLQFGNNYTNGRILITLGGGYSIIATPIIWTLLYLVLFNYDIPETLPEKWIKKWNQKINQKLPHTFYDPVPAFPSVPGKKEIERHNRDLIRRIKDAVAPFWI